MLARCLRLVGNLANTSYCNASDRFLAKKLSVSERTVRRYLLILKNRGELCRTTVAQKRAGRWTRKRLMKLQSGQPGFGPPEHEVRDFRRKVSAPAQPTEILEQPSHPLEAYRVTINKVEGFGDPYHEGMKTGDRPGQDAIIVPKSILEKRVAEIQAMLAASPKPDPEVQKLRSKYILARARQRKENT